MASIHSSPTELLDRSEIDLFKAVGRYAIYGEIAQGGMASVHIGRLHGAAGFSRIVAIKRLHPHMVKNQEFVKMFIDEARVAARVQHPNVVPILDVVSDDNELFLVMEYVHGATLAKLLAHVVRNKQLVPVNIAAAIMSGVLHGLHAAHEATDELGQPLALVHRDVSPQNVLVGVDGVARILDFGVAKAAGRLQFTSTGVIKGKVGYMPPEQLHGEAIDRRTDIYAAGVVLWESLVAARLFVGDGNESAIARALVAEVEPPSTRVENLPGRLDAVVLRALQRNREDRFPNALAMAQALERSVPLATPSEVGAWVRECAFESLTFHKRMVTLVEKYADRKDAPAKSIPPPSSSGEIPVFSESAPTEVTQIDTLAEPTDSADLTEFTRDQTSQIRRRPQNLPWIIAASLLFGMTTIWIFGTILYQGFSKQNSTIGNASPTFSGQIGTPPLLASSPKTEDVPALSAKPIASETLPPEKDPPAVTKQPPPKKTTTPVVKTSTPKNTTVPKPKVDCSTPYVIDKNGIKRYRRECF
jgi:eukaryotic-like serine/threonine-protein kinase